MHATQGLLWTVPNRRRTVQQKFNEEHGIIPQTIKKDIRDIIEIGKADNEAVKAEKQKSSHKLTAAAREKLITELTKQMKDASRRLEFEQAAFIRDKIKEIREQK